MTCSSPRLAASICAAVLLTAASALAQLPSPEQRAFGAVDRAGARFDSAGDREAMTRAAGHVLEAAESALNAFYAADRARDDAMAHYSAANEQVLALAVNCDNGYCGNHNLLVDFDGLEDALARDFEVRSGTSATIASYVEAVGIPGAAEARERVARYRRFANRMRGLRGNSSDMRRRRNELIREANAEVRAHNALHARAYAAHGAANRAALDALGRAGRTLSTAAGRLTDDSYPATRAGEVRRAAAALDRVVAAAGDPEVSNDSDATDAALDELILAARNVFVVLESHVAQVEQAAQRYDERDPEEQRPGPADAARPADVEAEPPGDLAGWVRAVNAEVERAERAAAEAEQAAAGSGGWWSRFTACLGARERMVRAASRVQALTFGTRRPRFVPPAVGDQAWDELGERLDAADQRARAACERIERSGPRDR